MTVLITFIQKAIMQGVCMLFGADGEILTEKSGNLNLFITIIILYQSCNLYYTNIVIKIILTLYIDFFFNVIYITLKDEL